MKVTFCGHSEVLQPDELYNWLHCVVRKLIAEGADTFYLGGYGAFDQMAASVIRKEKSGYTNLKMVLVLPYLNANMDGSEYDDTIYPPLESIPLRFAISKRNQWMVEQADVVVAYVIHSWGGAAKTLEYAKRRKKRIFLCQTR